MIKKALTESANNYDVVELKKTDDGYEIIDINFGRKLADLDKIKELGHSRSRWLTFLKEFDIQQILFKPERGPQQLYPVRKFLSIIDQLAGVEVKKQKGEQESEFVPDGKGGLVRVVKGKREKPGIPIIRGR